LARLEVISQHPAHNIHYKKNSMKDRTLTTPIYMVQFVAIFGIQWQRQVFGLKVKILEGYVSTYSTVN